MKQKNQGFTARQTAKKLIMIMCIFNMSACQSPHQHFDEKALFNGLQSQIVKTEYFSHKVYKNDQLPSDKLHIYLTGDGLPWMAGLLPSTDPTPRNTIIFDLIAQDSSSALILGRPCYHGLAHDALCDASFWTNKRYAPEIVDSLSDAIVQLSKQYKANGIVLIGYSGGGTLAVLIAEKIAKVSAVITIGANLNTQRWTQHHDVLPLNGSINPIKRPGLPIRVRQKHYVGSKDKIIPVSLVQTYSRIHEASELIIIKDFDHQCCWKDIWPEILQQIQ